MFGSNVCNWFLPQSFWGEDEISPRLHLRASRPGLMMSLGASVQWEEPRQLPPTSSPDLVLFAQRSDGSFDRLADIFQLQVQLNIFSILQL